MVVVWCGVMVHGQRGGVHGMTSLVDHGVEAVVVVSSIGDGADSAVSLYQAVLSLDYVTVTLLPLVLHVAGVVVLHTIVVGVLGVSLSDNPCG